MMSSEQDGKGGEGRGLPRRWGWRPAGAQATALIDPNGAIHALANTDGTWTAVGDLRGAASSADGAAAQAAAEAALWRRDGFGVGEVRGVPLPAILPYKQSPTALPGLTGMWRVTRWVLAAIGEGVEVDAVRVPAAVDKAARAWASISQIGEDGSHPADRASAAVDPAPLPWNWCPPCNQAVDVDDDTHEGDRTRCNGCRVWYVVCRDGDGVWSLQSEAEHDAEDEEGEPAPSREPSAPTDGELARLLRGELAAMRAERDRYIDMSRKLDAERDTLSERVTELEAERASAAAEVKGMDLGRFAYEAWVTCATEQDASVRYLPWGDIGPDKRARWCRSAVSTYERAQAHMRGATPPTHTVAALLAALDEKAGAAKREASALSKEGLAVWSNEESGCARGLETAASLIRATLTPSPLDAVAAEVCAEHKRIADLGPWDPHDHWAAICTEADSIKTGVAPGRVRLMRVGAQALAGMLACDAAKGGA